MGTAHRGERERKRLIWKDSEEEEEEEERQLPFSQSLLQDRRLPTGRQDTAPRLYSSFARPAPAPRTDSQAAPSAGLCYLNRVGLGLVWFSFSIGIR